MKNYKKFLFLIVILLLITPKLVSGLTKNKNYTIASRNYGTTGYFDDIKYTYYRQKTEDYSCNGTDTQSNSEVCLSKNNRCGTFTLANANTNNTRSSGIYHDIKTISDSGKTYRLYCLDPVNVSARTGVKVTRELNPFSGSTKQYDAAILYLLNKDLATFNSEAKTSYSQDYYDAVKEQAIRLITAAFGYERGESDAPSACLYPYKYEGWALGNAYAATVKYWYDRDGQTFHNTYNDVFGKTAAEQKMAGNGSYPVNPNKYKHSFNKAGMALSSSNNVLYIIRDYLVTPALKEAAKYKGSNVQTVNIKKANETGTGRNKTVTLKVENRPASPGYMRIDNVTINNSNVKMTLKIGNATYQSSAKNIPVTTNNIVLNFSTDLLTAVSADYRIEYTYCYSNVCYTGYVLKGASNTQRLVTIDKNESTGYTGAYQNTITFDETETPKEACQTNINIKSECQDDVDGLKEVGTIETVNKDTTGINRDENYCIVGNKDEAGNTYRVNQAFSGVFATNSACQVYCKENFHVSFEGIKKVTSGRYFKIGAQIKDDITCYVDNINYNTVTGVDADKHAEDIVQCLSAPLYIYNAYVDHKKDETLNKIPNVQGYQAGAMTFEFLRTDVYNDELMYSYDDEQFRVGLDSTSELKPMNKALKDSDVNFKITGCQSVDGNYNCTSGGYSYSSVNNYIYSNGTQNDQAYKNYYHKYIKIEISATANYHSRNQYYNQYPTGSITSQGDNNSSNIDGWPVAIRTETGLYPYKLKVQNLGNYYNWRGDGIYYGRLIGDHTDSVINAKDGEVNTEYVCYYIPNCIPCKAICVGSDGGACEWNICDSNNENCHGPGKCETCEPECESCLFTDGKLNVDFKPVSLVKAESDSASSNPINPTGRKMGYNWDTTSSSSELKYVKEKADNTVTELTESGERVYNEEPILHVEMTPQLIREIKRKSQDIESNNTNTLSCYDYIDSNNNSYTNVMCYSTFLDDLRTIDDGKYKDNIIFNNRIEDASHKDKNDITNKESSKSSYWTFFGINKNYQFGRPNNTIGGPSWK